MAQRILTAVFDVHAEAERAMTQLRASHVPDQAVSLSRDDDAATPRNEDVGVPDSVSSFTDLQGSELDSAEPATATVLRIDLAGLDLDENWIHDMIRAAGGRLQDE